ncbi:hypothetical protein U5M32_06085 [Streptococcus sp. TATVAM-FAB35]|uniref:hypothetical protein n=1 Tax=Streptococcus TaxID=1301 RepID=UPI0039808E9D
MNAKELLEEIKNNEVQYAIVDDKGAVFCDEETGNIMDIYGYSDDENGHFYGVYSEILGQVDSRGADDERILKSIELMLSLGKAVKRSELKHGKDFKRTYFFGGIIEKMELKKRFGL